MVATAIAIFGVDPQRVDDALALQARLDAAAARRPGFVGTHFTRGFDDQGDWAAAVSFASPKELRQWLGAVERGDMLAEGDAIGMRTHATIQLLPGQQPPDGTAVFLHTVSSANRVGFIQAMAHLHRAARDFPRHLGGLLLAPGDDSGPWISVVRFADDAALDEWLASAQRSEALVDLNATIEGDFEQVTRRTPFGSIVRVVNGSVRTTPNWKNAMTVFMVLFPTVMLLTRFLSPVLHDWGFNPGLAMWVSNIASVALLTWLFMPWATRIFAFWLDPIDGASPRTSLIGALIVAGVCLAFLAVFLAVPWLQFWSN